MPTIKYCIQSAGDTVRVWPVKREPGANPGRYQSLCAPKKRVPSVKTGHWETEKAGTRFAGIPCGRIPIGRKVKRPALAEKLTCRYLFSCFSRFRRACKSRFFKSRFGKGFFGVSIYAFHGNNCRDKIKYLPRQFLFEKIPRLLIKSFSCFMKNIKKGLVSS